MRDNRAVFERRNDLDWMRILAVLLLIPFHTARIFDIFEAFYVKNSALSPWLSYVVVYFLNKWHMPILFLLAGASTWYALRSRSGGQYVTERLKRLMVPFIFGTLLIVPPQMYFALLHRTSISYSYLRYYPTFFHLRSPGMPDYTGVGFTWGHLWFILNLFVISLGSLPLFLGLKSKVGRRFTAGLAGFLSRGPAVFLLALPFPFVSYFLTDIDGKPVFMFLMVFVFGFLVMSDDRYRGSLERNRWAALILGAACMSIEYVVMFSGVTFEDLSPGFILVGFVITFNTWFWLLAILGFGHKHLNIQNRVLGYAREAAYPFYVLHQTLIVIIGFYVVRWRVGVFPKYIVIVVCSLVATVVLFDLLVRRTNVTRFLFGMKPLAWRAAPRDDRVVPKSAETGL